MYSSAGFKPRYQPAPYPKYVHFNRRNTTELNGSNNKPAMKGLPVTINPKS